jgi:hypothetical protein
MNNKNNNAPHILNTSSNLLGLCFIVLTSIKILKLREATIIDELTVVALFFFMASSLLSFLSMRNSHPISYRLEKVADIVFLGGLSLLFITTLLISFNIID